MNYDELAFVNHQLAGMLKTGIPLEGALRQLCATMQRGGLKTELQKLEAELAKGTSLKEVLSTLRLPEIYRQMIRVGVEGNDLPGVLTLLADYFQRVSLIGMRLKGLMIYPLIVLLASLALSLFLASIFRTFAEEIPAGLQETTNQALSGPIPGMIWVPVFVLGLLSGAALLVLLVPPLRRALRWRLPGFKEAGLAQLAAAMRLMLRSGTSLTQALSLLQGLEKETPVGRDIAQWQTRLAGGHAQFSAMASESKIVPPLFTWLVGSGGENLAEGFHRAAEIYQARAVHRVEMLLYAALPVSILFLGLMLISQAYPLMRLFLTFGTMLDQLGSGTYDPGA